MSPMCVEGIAAAGQNGRGLFRRGNPVCEAKRWWGATSSEEVRRDAATEALQSILAAAASGAGPRNCDREKPALAEGVLMDRGDLLILLLHGTGAATHGRQEPSLV
jgi:hypothetical protein